MKIKLKKPLAFLFLTCTLCTCIDPYTPQLNKFESLLVVDAFLSDENKSCSVELSRTSEAQFYITTMVRGAEVVIRDGNGNSATLTEKKPGIYKTDSLLFRGQIGSSYTLYIKTPEGSEYESDPCIMYPVQPIDSIYFKGDQEIISSSNELAEGLRIFLDSRDSEDNKFFRWSYNEWWKIVVPEPKKYNYLNDSTFIPVNPIKQICWGNRKSDEIIILSTESAQTGLIDKKPILFIPSEKSNRLLVQYCIEVRQLSISKTEYEFWDRMKQINESGGDIFEKQPFPIISNIHNIINPDESALGYFQVSAVSMKRKYITISEVTELNVPLYKYDCARFELSPDDYPPPIAPGGGMTWDKIYKMYNGPQFSFVEPVFDGFGELRKLAFAKNACTDCTLNGSLTRPDFWIDLE
jgi:hypothetical protein